MREFIERQANAIEFTLQAHGVKARVMNGDLSPRLVHYHLGLPAGVRLAQLAPLLGELAAALGVSAVRLSTSAESGLPVLEAPRPDPVPVRLLPLAKKVSDQAPPCTATLGLDISGAPLLLRLDAPEVGAALIAGDSEAGKSSLLQTMALSMALHNSPDSLRMLFFDLAGGGRRGARRVSPWRGMEGLPHLVNAPALDMAEVELGLRWLGRLIKERSEALAQNRPIEGASLIVFMDGIDVALAGQSGRANRQVLTELSQRGRELRLFLVAATRRPQDLSGLYWGARLVGRCHDSEQARVASGMVGSGAEGLLGEGDFLALLGGETVRFQAAQASEEETKRTSQLLQQVAAAERRAGDALTSPEAQLKRGRGDDQSPRDGWASTGSGGSPRPLR